jgi:hypothetical protein
METKRYQMRAALLYLLVCCMGKFSRRKRRVVEFEDEEVYQ